MTHDNLKSYFTENQQYKAGSYSIVTTGDGSHSLFVPELNEHYHSTFGAIQESKYIFIEAGLKFLIRNQPTPICHPPSAISHPPSAICHPPSAISHPSSVITILEIGFGTGLNALLTQMEAEKSGRPVSYTTLEAFPLEKAIWSQLNFAEQLNSPGSKAIFEKLHQAEWNKPVNISSRFTLQKITGHLESFVPGTDQFHLVYFDVFGPDVHPHLWTAEIFATIFRSMQKGAVMVTFSVKGVVVRALHTAGFYTEKLPGPPGKRHILRAVKA